jgi:transposase-like protein
MKLTDERAQRGLTMIATADENIRPVTDRHYQVRSQTGNGWYDVARRNYDWTCTCPDYLKGNRCKHAWAVEFSLRLRRAVETDKPEKSQPATHVPGCPKCTSPDVTRKAKRQTRRGPVQRYRCKTCGHRFVLPSPLPRIHVAPRLVVVAFDLWAKKVSYRQIAHHLKDVHGVPVGKSTVERWVRALARTIANYADRVIHESGNAGTMWHGDETTANVNGKMEWTWNVMDHETRLWLASRISETKGEREARRALHKAGAVAGGKPEVFVTDGQPAYRDAVRREWGTAANPTRHMVLLPMRKHTEQIGVQGIPAGIHPGNNIMERLQGTQRERTKVLRAFDHRASAQELIDGLRGYYNLVRPHQGLDGLTPAEVAGVTVPRQPGEGRLWSALLLAELYARGEATA